MYTSFMHATFPSDYILPDLITLRGMLTWFLTAVATKIDAFLDVTPSAL
jgi:hypothetical protein